MTCHTVFEAESIEVARRDWRRIIVSNNTSCVPAYENTYEELWQLPAFLQDKTKAEIQDFYSPPRPCDRKTAGGRCSITAQNNSGGACTKGHLPYGCYQRRHEEWLEKWGSHRDEVRGPASSNSVSGMRERLAAWIRGN